jgi:hypothetical protein
VRRARSRRRSRHSSSSPGTAGKASSPKAAAGTATATSGSTKAGFCAIVTTLYRFDGNDQKIVYHYFDSTGGYSTGRVEPAAGELRFPEERYRESDRERVLRTVWRRDGDARLISVTEERKGDQWVEAWRVTYVRE